MRPADWVWNSKWRAEVIYLDEDGNQAKVIGYSSLDGDIVKVGVVNKRGRVEYHKFIPIRRVIHVSYLKDRKVMKCNYCGALIPFKTKAPVKCRYCGYRLKRL